jgi:hypothetical protein
MNFRKFQDVGTALDRVHLKNCPGNIIELERELFHAKPRFGLAALRHAEPLGIYPVPMPVHALRIGTIRAPRQPNGLRTARSQSERSERQK